MPKRSDRPLKPGISVVTPSVPERAPFLAEARASVAAQSCRVPVTHLVLLDRRHRGAAIARNKLLEQVETEWVAFLDDDDLFDRDHLQSLLDLAHATDSDVTWSWCRCISERAISIPRPTAFDPEALRDRNYIPVTVLARTAAVRAAGGFSKRDRFEDWHLWLRMLDNGARFAVVPRVTWTYRLMGDNLTFRPPGNRAVRAMRRALGPYLRPLRDVLRNRA